LKIKFSLGEIFHNDTFEKTDKDRAICFFVLPFILSVVLIHMALLYGNSFSLFYSHRLWILKILFTYLFILAFQGFVFAICHRDFLSFVITALSGYILDFVHQTMCATTGDPLLPTDLLMVGQFKKIAGYVDVPITLSEVIGLIVILALISVYLIICRKSDKRKKAFTNKAKKLSTIIFILYFIVYSYFFCINYNFRYTVLKNCNVNISAFNAVEDYISSGSVLAFFPKLGEMFVQAPEEYSKDLVDNITSKYQKDIPVKSTVQPSIIAIQNEAWWDPVNLKNVEFSVDPMSIFRDYEKDKTHARTGYLVTPVFAGGTCLPEFEFLTGFNTLNLPSNTYPYIQTIKEDTVSFVRQYRDNGYETVAIHPYHKDFYSRDEAYNYLGFEKFFGEEDMKYNGTKGVYISDENVSKEIISLYENKRSDKIFIYGVTMQNHGGYNYYRYSEYDIDVTSSVLSNDDLIGLKDYTQGVYDAIRAYKILTDYFSTIEEPVVIVMYGDHLPLLGISGSTYIDGGMVENGDESNYTQEPEFFYTPYVIWANYDISNLKIPEYMSPPVLGMEVYKMANIRKTPTYYNMFNELFTRIPVYHHKGLITADGTNYSNSDKGKYSTLIKEYKLLQHDLLYGNGYSK